MKIKIEHLGKDSAIRAFIQKADDSLAAQGYTEHSYIHVGIVAARSKYILETLHFPERIVELVEVAAILHDIGNMVNRIGHSQSGAIMAFRLLDERGMDAEEIAEVVTAIGNHDEGTGIPVSPMAAALILADKSDVRRSRVRNQNHDSFDIHDRVNYSVKASDLIIVEAGTVIELRLVVDTHYGSVMDFFEIFMSRMILCRKAAASLGLQFRLIINGQQLD